MENKRGEEHVVAICVSNGTGNERHHRCRGARTIEGETKAEKVMIVVGVYHVNRN